jgi:phosphate/sulfate permease
MKKLSNLETATISPKIKTYGAKPTKMEKSNPVSVDRSKMYHTTVLAEQLHLNLSSNKPLAVLEIGT